MRQKLLKNHNLTDFLMIFFVIVLLCGLLFLFYTSISKQLESKQNKLQAEAARLETRMNDIYRPFDRIALLLKASFESHDDFDSGIIQSVQYDREARLSYLSVETTGFGGTFAYSKNLSGVSDEIRDEIVRALNTVPHYDEQMVSQYYFISNHGFTVYFNHVDIGQLLDQHGTYDTKGTFDEQLMNKSIELYAAGQASALIGPYVEPLGDRVFVGHVKPVIANGEAMGVLVSNIPLSDLDAFVGLIGSMQGRLYLISDTGKVLAGYEKDRPLLTVQQGAATLGASELLSDLGITEQEMLQAAALTDAVIWRGSRVIIVCPVERGEFHIIYDMSIISLLSESNLILWFALSMLTMAVTIALLAALIRYKRKIVENNVFLQRNLKELDHLSQIDGLTGLMKPETILNRLTGSLKGGRVIVFMMDIDNFKLINDRFLHMFGNVVIRRIADVIQKHMPDGAYAGRFGGDEFVCIITGKTLREACEIAETIRRDVEALHFREHDATVTLSIGIAQSVSASGAEVMEKADRLLYKAKKNGRNQCLHEES